MATYHVYLLATVCIYTVVTVEQQDTVPVSEASIGISLIPLTASSLKPLTLKNPSADGQLSPKLNPTLLTIPSAVRNDKNPSQAALRPG